MTTTNTAARRMSRSHRGKWRTSGDSQSSGPISPAKCVLGGCDAPRRRTRVRPLLDLEVGNGAGELGHQRADLFGRHADIVCDELTFEIQLTVVFGTFAQIAFQAAFLAFRGGVGSRTHRRSLLVADSCYKGRMIRDVSIVFNYLGGKR